MSERVKLPTPSLKGNFSLEEVIFKRRSVRKFLNKNLSLNQISQILWAAQGITDSKNKFRAAPSAGAIYPIKTYIMNSTGFFLYTSDSHEIILIIKRDLRKEISLASYNQKFIAEAPISIILCTIYHKITSFYGKRGIRYADMEAGHIAENIHLQAVAMGLDSVPVGAFDDEKVRRIMNLEKDEIPVYIIPIGYRK